MKIASWNVNSINARLDHVKHWLDQNGPDLLLIQELKGLDFPSDLFKEIGYQSNAVTQKAYNGVAILSKEPQKVILDKLPGDDRDEQARYLEIDYSNIRVINIYLPNGNPVSNDSEKFPYKLAWMDRLRQHLTKLREENVPFLIGGDFNVIPEEKDCHNPKAWEGDALFRIETHQKWRNLVNLGLTDAFRVFHHDAGHYTFWDYQAGAWPQNKGIRIDHFLLSPSLSDRLIACTIDKEPRGQDKASDHTPILLELAG
ncbi:MAG TPA: exodeoxyribonuclease III [Alphaproteobacteria bacterium]|nr:exodeoxyribonuclease III [Alphaproteobacteria bacterium]